MHALRLTRSQHTACLRLLTLDTVSVLSDSHSIWSTKNKEMQAITTFIGTSTQHSFPTHTIQIETSNIAAECFISGRSQVHFWAQIWLLQATTCQWTLSWPTEIHISYQVFMAVVQMMVLFWILHQVPVFWRNIVPLSSRCLHSTSGCCSYVVEEHMLVIQEAL
jgi:hypothetical protein